MPGCTSPYATYAISASLKKSCLLQYNLSLSFSLSLSLAPSSLVHSSSLRESLGRNHYGPYRCRNRAYAPHHRRLGRSLPFSPEDHNPVFCLAAQQTASPSMHPRLRDRVKRDLDAAVMTPAATSVKARGATASPECCPTNSSIQMESFHTYTRTAFIMRCYL